MTFMRKLVGQRCYLSPCSPDDAATWARWENDLAIAIPLGDEAYQLSSPARVALWIDEINRHGEHVFDIVTLEDDVLIGRAMLFNLNRVDRHGMVGLMIGEQAYQNRGYGTEALILLLDYAFNLLNLNSVRLGTFAFNKRALRVYEKVGFREVGRWRQARLIAGKAYDAVMMDMLASEFVSPVVAGLLPD